MTPAGTQRLPAQNGRANGQVKQELGDPEEAAAQEEQIAEEAARIRAEYWTEDQPPEGEPHPREAMNRELFMRLWPLLKRPFHPGFVVHTGVVTGKPYESDGLRSVQVQIDRLNNVLTPLWWSYDEEYADDGKRCKVTVAVHGTDGECLVTRSSWGGVDRASTTGNLYKGSFTNAAKLAIARLGPGHEVYLGAVDLDPDVNEKVAEQQAQQPRQNRRRQPDRNDGPPPPPAVDAEAQLLALLGADGPLRDLRQQADKGMGLLGAPPAQRLRELQSCTTSGDLRALVQRIDRAIDALNTDTGAE